MNRVFRINPIGASYRIAYSDVSFNCKSCNEVVNNLSYDERTGIGEWRCSSMHLSSEKIGV